MLQFRQTDTAARLIFTLSENVSINDPYYLFVFTHILTKQKIKFVRFTGMDESNYTDRYNQFSVDANIEFLNAPIGQYNYKVYQQTSAINIDESLTGTVLEYGKLLIMRPVDFAFKQYNQPQSFKAYNG